MAVATLATTYWQRTISLGVLVTFISSMISPVVTASNFPAVEQQAPNHRHQVPPRQHHQPPPQVFYPNFKLRRVNGQGERVPSYQKTTPAYTDKRLFSRENKYQPYLEVGGMKYFKRKLDVAGVYDLFLPLWQTDDQLLFTDLRIFDRQGGSFEGNAHFGYRQLLRDKELMVGIYGAFDRRRTAYQQFFNQLTLGFEWWQHRWFIGGNFYQPLGPTKKYFGSSAKEHEEVITSETENDIYVSWEKHLLTTKVAEKALRGADAELGYAVTEELTGYLGGYWFKAAEVNTCAGPKLRFTYEYQPKQGRLLGVLDGLTVEGGVQYDKPRGAATYLGLRLKIGLLPQAKSPKITGFERHMVELVRRDPDVVVAVTQPEKTKDVIDKGSGVLSLSTLLQRFGLAQDASLKEVKAQWRKHSLRHHPDRHSQAPAEERWQHEQQFKKYGRLYEKIERKLRAQELRANLRPTLPVEPTPLNYEAPPVPGAGATPLMPEATPITSTLPAEASGEKASCSSSPARQQEGAPPDTYAPQAPKPLSLEPTLNDSLPVVKRGSQANEDAPYWWHESCRRLGREDIASFLLIKPTAVAAMPQPAEEEFKKSFLGEDCLCVSPREICREKASFKDGQPSGADSNNHDRLKDGLKEDGGYIYFLLSINNMTFRWIAVSPWFRNSVGIGQRAPPCCLLYEQFLNIEKEQIFFWKETTKKAASNGILDIVIDAAILAVKTLDYIVSQLISILIPIRGADAASLSFDYNSKALTNNLSEFERLLDSKSNRLSLASFANNTSTNLVFDLCSSRDQIAFMKVIRHAREILSTTGKLNYFLIKTIFNVYKQILTVCPVCPIKYFDELFPDEYCCDPYKECAEILKEAITGLVVDILAEDKHFTETKHLTFEQLKPLVAVIPHEANKKIALFIGLRLIQNHIPLPLTTLKYFISSLYSEEEAVRILAINLYYSLNKEIPVAIRNELFDALVLFLPKASYPQNSYIDTILDGFTLSYEQQTRLKIQRKIAAWYATMSQREKIFLAKQLDHELGALSARELRAFITELQLSQNVELIKIAAKWRKKLISLTPTNQACGLFCKLGKLFSQFIYPSQEKNEQEEALDIDTNTIEFTTGSGASLLLHVSQWEQLHKQLYQMEDLVKRLGFTDFRMVNAALTFAQGNKLDGETLNAAINSAAFIEMGNFSSRFGNGLNNENGEELLDIWVLDDISIYYGELLNGLIKAIKNEYKLSLSDANALDISIETLLDTKDLSWPASFLFSWLKGTIQHDPANLHILITGLETIADYKISPKMVDRNGRTAIEILEKLPAKQLLAAINRLIRDNHFFVSKNIELLIKELKELNKDDPLIQKLIDEFIELFPKIETLLFGQVTMQNGKPLCDWQAEDFQKWRRTISDTDNNNLAEIIAVLSQVAHKTVLFEANAYPRLVQLFALLLLMKSPQGGLVQISTGEGKSIINAMFDAIKIMAGHQVDIITTSGDLAQRDVLEYKDFYGLFNISVSSNTDDSYRGGAKQCYKSDGVYGDLLTFNGDNLRDITEDVKLGRGFDILIVDEADILLIDQSNMKTQLLSSGASGFDLLNPIFVYIFGAGTIFGSQLLDKKDGCYFKMPLLNATQAQNLNSFKLQEMENSEYGVEPIKIGENCLEVIKGNLTDYAIKNLFAFEQIREARAYVVPNHLKPFAEDQLPNWIESFFQAYAHVFKRNYIISLPDEENARYRFSDITVVEPSTGVIVQRLQWGDGLHQFLEVKHRLTMRPENVVTTFMSYYGYFNKYKGRIYGVTGTLGNTLHHEFLKSYGVDIHIVPAFVEKDLTEFKTIFAINEESWLDEIIAAIYRIILTRKRAGLVVAETIEEVEKIRDRLTAQGYNPSQIFTYGIGHKNDKKIFESKLKPGDIIITTNLGGRGVDIKINREVQKNGGLHLIVTAYPVNMRTRDQVYGRPARKGDPGSKQLIINIEQLDRECIETEDILGCLDDELNRQEKLKLEHNILNLLPNIKFLDELFELFVELIKEADSPTGYKLVVGKPKSSDKLQPLSFYLYEEKGKIRVKIVDEKELVDLDITDSILAIDPQTEKHLKTVLSNTNNAASSLNGQDREVINFIATLNDYTKISSIYEHVKYEFNIAAAQGEQNRSHFKFLFDWQDHEVDRYLQEKIELRKKYWLWLAVRKLYNNEFEIRQITEEWGMWLKKRYQQIEGLGRSINAKEKEEIKKEFTLFKKEIVARIENKDKVQFIRNPAYLTLKAWRYLQIYYNQLMVRSAMSNSDQGIFHIFNPAGNHKEQGWLSYIYSLGKALWEELKSRIGFGEENYNPPDPLASATGFLEDAIKLDDVYSWIPYNALSYIRLLKDGRGITEETQIEEANAVKGRFIEDVSHATDRINQWNIPAIDGQLSFLFGAKLANYSDASIAHLSLQRKILEIIKEKVFQKNIDITARAAANQMIRNGNPVDLIALTENINITQAILEAANVTAKIYEDGGNNVRSSAYAYLDYNTRTLDSASRQLIIDQIMGAGGYLYNVELYELEKEEKSWWETAFTGLLGVFQVVAGIAMIGLGNVFGATFGMSLITQGIGDLIQVGVSIFTNTPINFGDYLNSKGMAMGIGLLTAGTLHFLNMVPGLELIGTLAKGVGDHIDKIGKFAFIGKMAAMQVGVTAASALIYDVARKEVSPEEIKSEVQVSIKDMIEEYGELLNMIIALDKFNDNSVLRNALDQRIKGIVSRYQVRFQDDETKFYKGLGGSFADAFGFGSLVRATTDVTLGVIKNKQAIGKIISKIKEAIREMAMNISPPKLFSIKLQREFGEVVGKQLGDAVDSYMAANDAKSVECDKLNDIQVGSELTQYKQGVVQTCGYVSDLFNQDYSSIYEAMGSNWGELITQAIVSIQKQEIVKPVSDSLGQSSVKLVELMVQEIKGYKAKKEAERANYSQDQEKMHREKLNIEGAVKDSGLIKESLENEGRSGKEEKREQVSKHRVKKRDTLHKIAKEHGVSYHELIAANPQLKDPNLIYPNQIINIPAKAASGSSPTTPTTTTIPKAANDKSFSGAAPTGPSGKQDPKPSVPNIQDHNPSEFIEAAGAAYSRKKNDDDYKDYYKPLIDRGYKQFDDKYENNGFAARAFKRQTPDGKVEVIIAYSGTDKPTSDPKTWGATIKDIKGDDANIFLGKIPEQQADALAFAKGALEKVGSHNREVIFTGHSLGAALAQLTLIERGTKGERAVAFDSPGMKTLVAKLVNKNFDPKTITIYNGLANPINSFGEHLVEPIMIYEKGTACFGCILPGSIKQHGLKNFYKAYNQDGTLKSNYEKIYLPIKTQGLEANGYLPGYRDYLRSMWLYQYRYNFFDKQAVPGFPEVSSQAAFNQVRFTQKTNFRETYPTAQVYVEAVIKCHSKNRK